MTGRRTVRVVRRAPRALALIVVAGVATTTISPAGAGARRHADEIVISNFMFSPMSLRVAPGAVITVLNKDTVVHTLSAIQGQFNTGDIRHDQTKRFKAPKRPGTYHYICNIHQFMTGVIIVK